MLTSAKHAVCVRYRYVMCYFELSGWPLRVREHPETMTERGQDWLNFLKLNSAYAANLVGTKRSARAKSTAPTGNIQDRLPPLPPSNYPILPTTPTYHSNTRTHLANRLRIQAIAQFELVLPALPNRSCKLEQVLRMPPAKRP